jgi:glutamine synthetase
MFTKAYSRQRNLTASFMALLGASFPGIGGHISISLCDAGHGGNVFAEAKDPLGLSQIARAFIAGVAEVVPDAMPMCAHTVNAYRRLAPGSWAPKTMSWAPYSYAAAIRTAAETPEKTRLEFRLPGSDCNVFLALALLLGGGLHGIEQKLALTSDPITTGGPSEIPDGVPRLPRDLAEATARMKSSATAKRVFGAPFVDHFVALCEFEHDALVRAVSAAEVERYLEGG